MIDLNSKVTQKQFGDMVGISQPAVSDLLARGVLLEGDIAGAWLRGYCTHLREVAAGRAAAGGMDLATERAGLAREQRIKVSMQNAVTRGELAPRIMMTQVLAATASRVGSILDRLPGQIKRRVPALDQPTVDMIREEITECRNTIAAMKLSEAIDGIDMGDDVEIEAD